MWNEAAGRHVSPSLAAEYSVRSRQSFSSPQGAKTPPPSPPLLCRAGCQLALQGVQWRPPLKQIRQLVRAQPLNSDGSAGSMFGRLGRFMQRRLNHFGFLLFVPGLHQKATGLPPQRESCSQMSRLCSCSSVPIWQDK